MEMALGFGALPTWFNLVVGVPLLFLPYVGLDALLARRRQRRSKLELRAA
jgi:hypothetical protein